MKRFVIAIVGLAFVLSVGLDYVCAQKREEWTQGEFAMWLVKKVGGQKNLPRAATSNDACSFLAGLGFEPAGGWIAGETLSDSDVASMVEGGAGQSFDQVVTLLEQAITEAVTFAVPEVGIELPGGGEYYSPGEVL